MGFPVSNTALCYVIGMGLLVQYITVLYIFSPPNGMGIRTAELLEPDAPTKKATFGMAWFWFPEAQFGATDGIIRTRVGYAGGTKVNPTYRDLGDHTETVDVDYDPEVIDYAALLKIFWENHDPTTNCSLQYMSTIFYHDEEQKVLAEKTFEEEQKKVTCPIQTAIIPFKEFYEAENYHQKYQLQRHPALVNALDVEPGEDLIKSHVAARINGYVGGYGSVSRYDKEWKTWGITEKMAEYIREELVSG